MRYYLIFTSLLIGITLQAQVRLIVPALGVRGFKADKATCSLKIVDRTYINYNIVVINGYSAKNDFILEYMGEPEEDIRVKPNVYHNLRYIIIYYYNKNMFLEVEDEIIFAPEACQLIILDP